MSALATQAHGVLRDVVHTLVAAKDQLPDLGTPVRVYADPPADAVFPYVTLGAVRTEDRSDSAGPRAVHSFSLHLWDRDTGGAALLNLLSRIQVVLESDMPHSVVTLFADIFPDRRGGTDNPFARHGLLRLRVITE